MVSVARYNPIKREFGDYDDDVEDYPLPDIVQEGQPFITTETGTSLAGLVKEPHTATPVTRQFNDHSLGGVYALGTDGQIFDPYNPINVYNWRNYIPGKEILVQQKSRPFAGSKRDFTFTRSEGSNDPYGAGENVFSARIGGRQAPAGAYGAGLAGYGIGGRQRTMMQSTGTDGLTGYIMGVDQVVTHEEPVVANHIGETDTNRNVDCSNLTDGRTGKVYKNLPVPMQNLVNTLAHKQISHDEARDILEERYAAERNELFATDEERLKRNLPGPRDYAYVNLPGGHRYTQDVPVVRRPASYSGRRKDAQIPRDYTNNDNYRARMQTDFRGNVPEVPTQYFDNYQLQEPEANASDADMWYNTGRRGLEGASDHLTPYFMDATRNPGNPVDRQNARRRQTTGMQTFSNRFQQNTELFQVAPHAT